MSKHTPGPWVVDDSNPNLVARLVDGVYEYVCAVEPSSFSTREYSKEQEESDARLISAAPELLEALKEITPNMPPPDAPCHYGIVPQSRCCHCQRIARARAAIAKAEGKK
jgi:hypothetical protein